MGQQQGKSLIQQGPGLVFQRVTIGSLPDDVLLDIFDFYRVILNGLGRGHDIYSWTQNWDKLVHVCQRWRYLIFASPIRLDLQLYCTEKSPVRKSLHVWPPFPLIIHWTLFQWSCPINFQSVDNLIAALEHRDRVRQIRIINSEKALWKKIATAMEEPFPALRSLFIHAANFGGTLFPDTFLNGFAPCLQDLSLVAISLPSLPQLLLSTSDLTSLHLDYIYLSWSPEEMAKCLSALPKLRSLNIHFRPQTPYRQRRNRPVPPTRFVLPALAELSFKGASEYLEVLAAQIDAPLLDHVMTDFQTQPIFDIPHTSRLFGHLDSFTQSNLSLTFTLVEKLPEHFLAFSSSTELQTMSFRLDWQVIFVAQICSQILAFPSSVKSLNIDFLTYHVELLPGDEIDPATWLQLFHSFSSVQSLNIPASLEASIGAALQSLTGEFVAEVFPSLQSLSIVEDISEEAGQQAIESFITARQHNGRPVAVSRHTF